MGRAHGEACRESIRSFISLSVERLLSGSRPPRTRERLLEQAAGYLPHVREFAPAMEEEMRGIAEGADVPFEEVLFLQVRTHLMKPPAVQGSSAGAQQPPPDASQAPSGGCTAFALEPRASGTGSALIGQNWDWDPSLEDVCFILTRRPKGAPAFMSFTQPGLIAYIGLSEAGVAVCLNLLLAPGYRTGVPTYCILRSLYEQRGVEGCRRVVSSARIGMSQNFLVMTPDGAIDFEVTTGRVAEPAASNQGVLLHTNHFLDEGLAARDELADRLTDTRPRYARIGALMAGLGRGPTVDDMKAILSDHDGYPRSICRHPNDQPSFGHMGTVCSLIMEPAEGRMHISRGNPCTNPYATYTLS